DELPDRLNRRVALRLQDAQDTQYARCVAGEPGLRQLEYVVARDVGDGLLDCVMREFTRGQQQRQLVDLLPRGEEVALAVVGQERERLARRVLLVTPHSRRDPCLQG